MDEGRVMPSAKEEGESARGDGDEDIPDWTTWLRSRLERVSSSERTAAEQAEAAPDEVVADKEPEEGADEKQVVQEPSSAPASPPPPPPVSAPPVSAPPVSPPPPPPVSPPPVSPEPPRPASPAPAPAPVPTSGTDSSVGSETEALRAAVTALTAGVGALTDTFTAFREQVIERLHEYSETVQRASERTAAELEDNRRMQAVANAELRQNDAEVTERLQRLADGMEGLAALRSDDERWAEVMGRLLDEVDAERQAGEREVLAAGGVIERLDGLEGAMARITAEVSGGMGRSGDALEAEQQARERDTLTAEKVLGRLNELDQALRQIAADVGRARRSNDEVQLPARAVRASDASTRKSSSSTRKPPTRAPVRRSAPLRADRPTPASRRRPDIR